MLTNIDKLTENGCGTEKTDKVCRSRGGESCAFDGAMIVLQPIADAAHVVHGPIACCGNAWEGRGSLSKKGSLHRMGFTTDMSELDIIYGSVEKLFHAIRKTFDEVRPKAIFVYSTCVSGLIGEDIDAVCRRAETALGIRVIPVNAPGFVGPKNLGNRIAGEVLLDHVIGTGEPPPGFSSSLGITLSGSAFPPLKIRGGMGSYDLQGGMRGVINLIGEYNIAGDLWLTEPVLEKAGLKVLSRMTGDATFEEITWAHRANLNVVVCSRALINVAKEMEKRYGIPYVEVSFFGKTEMARALRAIRDGLSRADSSNSLNERIESLIAREEEKLAERLIPYAHLKGKKAVLYTGGVKSWSFISALQDLGIEVVAVGTKKSTLEDEEKMREILGENAPLVEDVAPKNLLSLLKEKNADMLIAGGRNLYLSVKEGYPFVDVNQERHTAYAGYEGLVCFAEQISNSVRFYERSRGQRAESRVRNSAAVMPDALRRDGATNPLKHSASIGAAIALQGIHRALPVIHGAQGCTFLGKVLLTKHFREPVALAGTRLFAGDVIMGSDDRLEKTVTEFIEKNAPDVIAVLTSGLSEAKGDDVSACVSGMKSRTKSSTVLHIPTPDYDGGLESGYSRAVEVLLSLADERGGAGYGQVISRQVNVLAGSHLSPADFNELREIIESFDLKPILLPDLSSLDGSRQGISPLAVGGTTIGEVRALGASAFTIAIGASLESPARMLYEKFGIEYRLFESLADLEAIDAFFELLSMLSGRPVPQKYGRQKRS
ncbi:MAG: nitrogenase iron-molybdenum cofactor biosynthesis protein NifE, partial [Nitrospirota bacterium]|nr:nitrogenase iron-molybdenum cofactor biosynthesis protein NifE [Nitrospirota bacterium]